MTPGFEIYWQDRVMLMKQRQIFKAGFFHTNNNEPKELNSI